MQFKINGLEIKRGNRKMPDDTLIFNMGPASCCPSRALGMCKVPEGHCYALRDEKFFGEPVIQYRLRQMHYWLTKHSVDIKQDFAKLFNTHKKALRSVFYLRFNESGDFWTQECVTKLSRLSNFLQANYDITTYGFTARADLDFRQAEFLVKGSGCDNGNNGKSIVVGNVDEIPEGFSLCPVDCDSCGMCRKALPEGHKKRNVAFQLHR